MDFIIKFIIDGVFLKFCTEFEEGYDILDEIVINKICKW